MGYFSPTSSNPTGSMAAMLADAQKLPDSTLAEVLAGKSQAVPQFAAMLAAQSRQQLRTAQNAAAAGKTPPTIKDQLAASEAQAAAPQGLAALAPQQAQPAPQQQQMASAPPAQGGLDQLPADNMKNMAGGGIVAFEEGGDVPRYYDGILTNAGQANPNYANPEELAIANAKIAALNGGVPFTNPNPYTSAQANADYIQPIKNYFHNKIRDIAMDMPGSKMNKKIKEAAGRNVSVEEQYSEMERKRNRGQNPLGSSEQVLANLKDDNTPPTYVLNKDSTAPAVLEESKNKTVDDGTKKEQSILDTGTKKSFKTKDEVPADAKPAEATGLSFEDFLKKHSTDNLGGIQALMDKYGQEHADEKSRTGGRALMSIGEGLLKNPTLAGGVAEGSRGVQGILDAQQKANADFNKFNVMGQIDLAKAKDAAEKGDMQSALAYQKNAQDANYQKGIIEHYAADLKAKQPLYNAQANFYNQRGSGAGAGLDLRAHTAAETSVGKQMSDFLKTPAGRKLAKDPTQLAAYRQNLYNTAYGNLVGKPYTPQSLQLSELPKDVDMAF
jgi:hypothetical protein